MSLAMASRGISPLIHISTDASNKIALETQSIADTVMCFSCSATKNTTRQMSYIELKICRKDI